MYVCVCGCVCVCVCVCIYIPCRVGLVVSVSAWVIKLYKMPPCMARNALGRSLAVQPDCINGRVVYGTVYGEMHLRDLLGSFVRVGYRIPDFCLVLHGLCCPKSTLME